MATKMKRGATVGAIAIAIALVFYLAQSGRLPLGKGDGSERERSGSSPAWSLGRGPVKAADPRMDQLKQGKNLATVKDFEKFLAAAGHRPEAWIVAYVGTACNPELLEELKKFPDSPEACFILATGASTEFESLSWAKKLVALQPENGFAKLVLADALEKLGRFEDAAALEKEALEAADFKGFGEGPAKCLAEHQDSLGETEKISLVRWRLDGKFFNSSVLIASQKPKEVPQDPVERLSNLKGILDRMNKSPGFAQFATSEERQYFADVTLVRLAVTLIRKTNDPKLVAEWKPKLDAWGEDHPDPYSNSEWDRLEPSEVSKRLQESLSRYKTP